MRRILSVAVLFILGSLSFSPSESLAHWGRWGCGSYYSGYTSYYPRYYYQTYNNCYYGNYGSYYGNSYAPYPTYGYNPLYNNLGLGNLGLGGGNILGLLAGNALTGANLSGSFLQPSYLSMPVSVGYGYGQSGFLQIPIGSPAGRATYLQIPVNTGYGPSSYLQIELGRNSSNAVPASPTPSTTPNVPPFGAVPGTSSATAGQFTYDISRTPADEIPPVVLPLERASAIASVGTTAEAPTTSVMSAETNNSVPNAISASSTVQFVSWSSVRETTRVSATTAMPPLAKDTSFSLAGRSLPDDKPSEAIREPYPFKDLTFATDRESTPWVVK